MSHTREKPGPAHPKVRKTELPWNSPKSAEEDPDATALVAAILHSPEYREADEDVDFLKHDDTRGVRLQLDYLKAENLFQQHGIAHSIVVFGSTRIPEPKAARQKVKDLESKLSENPSDKNITTTLRIAGASKRRAGITTSPGATERWSGESKAERAIGWPWSQAAGRGSWRRRTVAQGKWPPALWA